MKKHTEKRIFWIFLVFSIIWMGIIFSFSAQPAADSAELSMGVMDWLLIYFSEIPVLKFLEEKGILEFIIRKTAHAAEYGILAAFLGITISRSRGWRSRWQIKTIVLCFLYASTDEFHQLFVPGRSGQIRDVAIDTAGAFCAVLLLWMCDKLYIRYGQKQCF